MPSDERARVKQLLDKAAVGLREDVALHALLLAVGCALPQLPREYDVTIADKTFTFNGRTYRVVCEEV